MTTEPRSVAAPSIGYLGHRLADISAHAPVAKPPTQPRGTPIAEYHVGPQPIQRVEFKGKKGAQARNKIKAWAGKEADDVVTWFEGAAKLSLSHVDQIVDKKFKTWWDDWGDEDPTALTVDVLLEPKLKEKIPGKAVDPLDEVRKKLKGSKGPNFTVHELMNILDMKATDGWDAAILHVTAQHAKAEQDQKLKIERTAKYAPAKALGDGIFDSELLKAVWANSYQAAIAGSGSPNLTVGKSFSDLHINAAAKLWHGRQDIVPAAAGAATVSNFHVPGDPWIQDKSKRADKPDLNRGRQADFICKWGGVSINVHVNSTQVH